MLLAGLYLCLSLLEATSAFRICAFNVQAFGDSKASDRGVMEVLVKEVRDSKGGAVPALVNNLNRFDRSHNYKFVASGRLGRGTYLEQYVFIYRSDVVDVRDQYQYPDTQKGDPDAFSREPFIVRFHSPHTELQDLVLVPQHTTPKNATREIDELYDVFLEIRRMWRIQDVMFLGDFNAACGYVPKKDWPKIRLRSNPEFHWLIGDKTDTTVRDNTVCAYDRIVVHGDAFLSAIVPQSAKPFNFPREFRLTEEEALVISDHYPVEVELRLSSGQQEEHIHHYLIGISVAILLLSVMCGPNCING